MKILLTGVTGQLGYELQQHLQSLGQVFGLNSSQLNLADVDQMVRVVRAIQPDMIVNPAAYTAVDAAETDVEMAMAINAVAPAVLAEEAKKLAIPLIHYSTDYVFDGQKQTAYVETDVANPLNVYGQSKLAGEQAIQSIDGQYLILRSSWVYALRAKNFVLTIQRLLHERQSISVVNDQYGAPTSTAFLAHMTQQILQKTATDWPVSGLFHLTTSGHTTWYQFAQTIKQYCDTPCQIIPISSANYPTPAQRPRNSCLATTNIGQTFGLSLVDWHTEFERLFTR